MFITGLSMLSSFSIPFEGSSFWNATPLKSVRSTMSLSPQVIPPYAAHAPTATIKAAFWAAFPKISLKVRSPIMRYFPEPSGPFGMEPSKTSTYPPSSMASSNSISEFSSDVFAGLPSTKIPCCASKVSW